MDEIPKLSTKEAVILDLLVNQGSMYGLEMIRANDEVKRDTVLTLGRMAEKGYVESNLEDAPSSLEWSLTRNDRLVQFRPSS